MYGVAFDPETLEMRGNAVQILDRVLAKGTGSVDFDVADDGSLVYASRALAGAPKRTLVWVDRAGREELLRLAPTSYTNPRLSGGEPRLAVEYEGDIWVWDLDRLTHNRLTISPAHDSRPLWTSDGDVLFSSLRRGWWDIYRKAADGTGGVERLTDANSIRFPSSLSPDGDLLLYLEGPLGARDLGILPLGGDREARAILTTEFNETRGEISPDGRWLAYQSDESGSQQIYVSPFPEVGEARWTITPRGGVSPAWARDGRELFYLQGTQTPADFELGLQGPVTMMAVAAEDAPDFGVPKELFTGEYFASGTGRHYDVSADGQQFLMVKPAAGETGPSAAVILVQNWFEELKRLVPTD